MQRLYAQCFGDNDMPALIREKAIWLERILPCTRVIDFGGMWRCNGFYSFLAVERSSGAAVLVDASASDRFLELQRGHPTVRWEKMDFWEGYKSGDLWKLAATDPADGLIFYDILLHQPEPLPFVAETVRAFGARKAVLANPVARKSAGRNDLTFVPGSHLRAGSGSSVSPRGLDIRPSQRPGDHSGWVWVFSHGYLLNALEYYGLEVKAEKLLPTWPWGNELSYSLIEIAPAGS